MRARLATSTPLPTRAWRARVSSTRVTRLACLGEKRGTAHLRSDFEVNAIPMRSAGDYWVVTDENLDPRCGVRITTVAVQPFVEVGADFARFRGRRRSKPGPLAWHPPRLLPAPVRTLGARMARPTRDGVRALRAGVRRLTRERVSCACRRRRDRMAARARWWRYAARRESRPRNLRFVRRARSARNRAQCSRSHDGRSRRR